MAEYWRAAIKEEFKETMQEFINQHPELGFDDPKDLMIHATRDFMMRNKQSLSREEIMEYFEQKLFDESDT